MDASVVVITYNRRQLLESCLDSLSAQSYPSNNFEVIVVDGRSTDGTEDFVEEYTKKAPYELHYIVQDKSGICNARNAGIRVCKGNIICFTDDDCIADKNWLKNLLSGYSNEKVGCVGGEIIAYPPRTIVEKYSDEHKLVSQTFMVCGPIATCNTSYRKNVLLEVGGFDEDLCTLEDGDVGIRVKFKGYTFLYAENAIILHKHRSTLRNLLKQQYWYGRGHQRLHKKYLKNFTPEYTLLSLPFKIAFIIITYPLVLIKSLTVKDRRYYLARPIIYFILSLTISYGILIEMFFGKAYTKEKYPGDIPYIREKSIGRLIKYLRKRLPLMKKNGGD
jgi:glycosyltransferase involved in cell wall biosynthesis